MTTFFKTFSTILFTFILCSEALGSTTSPDLNTLEDLSQNTQWLRLLHYHKGFWNFTLKSQADGKGFFISPNGDHDPLAELGATYEAMSETSSKRFGKDKVHAQCSFPARYKFLKKYFPNNTWKDVSCPKLEAVLKKFNGESLTYVFSTAFPNNPGSMFGHTFVRINARSEKNKKHMELFDHGLSYAALTPEGFSGMALVIKGLFGLYPGFFSSPLYYEKIAEYTHFESRDLWEYALDINPEETDMFIKATWEIAHNGYFDYYFFDENCAFHLLSLLEIAKPEWKLTTSSFFVSPVDSILSLTKTPGAVTEVSFRPSVKTKFLTRLKGLDSEQREQLIETIDSKEKVTKTPQMTSQLLDGLDSYYKYMKQRMGGKLNDEQLEKHYQVQLLQSKFPKPQKVKEWADTRPDIGHGVSRVQLSYVSDGRSNSNSESVDLSYKFAYHDLLDSDRGFTPFSQIDFVELKFSKLHSENYYLQSLRFIEIQSLYPITFFEKRKSWRFKLEYNKPYFASCEACYQWNMDAALGLSFPTFNETTLLYSFIGADADYLDNTGRLFVGLKPEIGIISQVFGRGKIWGGINYLPYFGPHEGVMSYFVKTSFTISQKVQLRASLEGRDLEGSSSPEHLGRFDFNFYY